MKTIVPLLALVAACGGSNMSLSMRAGSSSAGSTALTLSNGIVLSRVRIVVRDVKLEREKSGSSSGADLEEHEMEAGPFFIDLSGATLDNGAPVQVTAAAEPAGTYKEIKFKIHKPGSAESSDPGIQAMAAANASIIADGTIDGAAFSFVTSMDVEQEIQGSFTLSASSNLTLNVDPSSWFGGSMRLDPRDGSVKGQIESNIQQSFKAFKDDDKDGHEDH